MLVNVKKLNKDANIPTRGSEYAAGYDLYACIPGDYDILIKPGETVKIGTGIAIEIPENYFGAVYARSGLATKKGLRPANCVGVIDADYRGEVIVALHNDSGEEATISNGDRIAQLVISPFLETRFVVTDTLGETKRNDGGFGSTDVEEATSSKTTASPCEFNRFFYGFSITN